MTAIYADHPFSITHGGPLYHLLQRAHLLDHRGNIRARWLIAVLWLPIVMVSLIELATRGVTDEMILDPTVHVRFLIALPLFVLAERMLERRCERAAYHMIEERLAERASLEAIFSRAEHLRDAWIAEAVIAAIVLVMGQLALAGVLPSGLLHPIAHEGYSASRVWYAAIALPFVQFLTARWLWRWVIWIYVLARLCHLPLALNTLHPDRSAGIRFLEGPIEGFAAFIAATAAMAATGWSIKIHAHEVTIESLTPMYLGFVVIVIVVACAPLLLFTPQLYEARHRDTAAYHKFAHDYAGAFRRKWLGSEDEPPEPGTADLPSSALGSGDIQSFNDLIGSHGAVEKTRLRPFGIRSLGMLCVGALLPMLPLLFATMSVTELAKHLGKMMFGLAA